MQPTLPLHTSPPPLSHIPNLTPVSLDDRDTLAWLGFWDLWTGAEHTFQAIRSCAVLPATLLNDPTHTTHDITPSQTRRAARTHLEKTRQIIQKKYPYTNISTLQTALTQHGLHTLQHPQTWVVEHTPPPHSPLPKTPFLYGWGDPTSLHTLPHCGVAMVGSRSVSHSALSLAREAAYRASKAHCIILSGGALGIDTACHEGALNDPQGRTIAILGSGLDHLYPNTNTRLFHTIAQRPQSCVLSPFPRYTTPSRYSFPQRNAWITALARTLLVVRAQKRSGSLITAHHAHSLQRPIYAFPTSPENPKGAGSNTLINEGKAMLTLHPNHFASTLHNPPPKHSSPPPKSTQTPPQPSPDSSPLAQSIQRSLQHQAIHQDEIARLLNVPHSALTGCLLELELNGCIKRLPGGLLTLQSPQIYTDPS